MDVAEACGTTAPFYQPTGQEEAVFRHAFRNRIPVLLKGPTGTGKSRFVEYMATQLRQPLITVSCHEETSSTDLIGRFIIKGAETIWIDGPLTTAVKTGAILYLDEVAEARPDVIVAIHPLTDHRRELFIDKLGTTVPAAESFMLVASFNPGYQRGYKELKPSTRQRFAGISFRYPDASSEAAILIQESGVEEGVATRLVKIAARIRNLRELGLAETVSTRLLVDAAKLIHSGLPRRLAVRTAMIEPLTDDDETIAALCDLADLMI
ncbi:AAA family ATPase [Chitinophaga flava]|uniref:AAA family ATPase n=2 Tax=Chitinophaga flava TaxID=2259036 RepID=A0A365Y700_9BACT|nr:AAA family ATPase [Chitinophaga flava]